MRSPHLPHTPMHVSHVLVVRFHPQQVDHCPRRPTSLQTRLLVAVHRILLELVFRALRVVEGQ